MGKSILQDIKTAFQSGNYLMQIIILNIGVFLLINIVKVFTPFDISQAFLQFFALSADLTNHWFKVWGYFTYMFTHEGLWHLVFNLMWFYYPGVIISDLYGQKKLAEIYIFSGLSGGLLFVILAQLLPGVTENSYLIGASAGVMGVLIGAAALQPNYTMHLIFLGPVRLKYIALVGFILSSVVDLNLNTGGKISHFGGAIFGAYYAFHLKQGRNVVEPIISFLKNYVGKKHIKVVHRSATSTYNKSEKDTKRIDEILDKISKSGYESLTKEEKEYLFKFKN